MSMAKKCLLLSPNQLKKRIDIGKIYEDDFLVLNIRLKQYGYGNALSLLRDFKDGIFPERFYKPQGALKMGENEDTNGMVSLINGKPNPDFFNHINCQKETLRKQLEVMKSTTVRQLPRFQSDSTPTTSTITTAS